MNSSEDLWKKYCSFFEKSFPEQLEYNEKKLKEHFEKWKKTKMAEHLCPKGVEKFEDIPLTTYEDYPILHKFGEEIEKLEKTVPRRKGEPWWDYYQRISRQVIPMLEGWMTDEYSFCLKTSGSGGKSKWLVHGKTFSENVAATAMHSALFACSDEWGKPKIREGDTLLNMVAPLPYGSGMVAKSFEESFNLMPPIRVLDEVTDMRKKTALALKYVEEGGKVDFMVGAPSTIKMVCEYFTNPEHLWKDRYQSLPLGIAKLALYLKYLQSKSSKKYEKARDILPIKGLMVGAWDGTIYLDYFRDQFNIEPFNLYATSDTCVPFMGRPHRKFDLFPNLSNIYFEFSTDKGGIKKIHELTKNQVYELIVTTFGSLTIRYHTDDLFRVIDFEDDGMPVFRFESRKIGMIDIYSYYRLSEALARDALSQVGFVSENWAVCQEMAPKEHIKFLLEKELDYTEQQMVKLLFESLRELLPDFDNYVRDFKIRDPREAIEAEYLNKGAFMRYMAKRQKEGVPFGQIKPLKIIGPKYHELAELLRSV